MPTLRVNKNPAITRISPRAEEFVRYINDMLIHNLNNDSSADVTLELPSIVMLAYKITYETGPFTIQNVDPRILFAPQQ